MSTMSPLTGLRSVKCYGCGCTIDVVLLSGDAEPYNGAKALCDPCTVKYDEKRIRDERIQDYGILEDQERINGDCRASCFRNSKPAIEADNPDAWKYARQWKYNSENIFLHGKTGTGKTVLLQTLSMFLGYSNKFRFKIYSGFEMERVYMKDPLDQQVFNLEQALKSKMFGMDDIGEEHAAVKRYGTEINVGIETLTLRHLEFMKKGNLTFATTNLTPDMFTTKYGARIESRIHEMFNLIGVTGKDLRKNK